LPRKPAEKPSVADQARENPYRFFSFADIAALFGFGVNTMTEIVRLGAPVVARKLNPDALKAWLTTNAEKVGKIREE
jgi:hypothetical protein